MNRYQQAVAEFHASSGWNTLDTPEGRLLRAKLIMEEAVETVAALGFHVDAAINETDERKTNIAYFEKEYEVCDLLDFIDGLCDLTYVTMGGACDIPINLDHHFEEVHRANMQKMHGPKREDGKRLKPEGWQPPDHQRIIDLYETPQFRIPSDG